MGDRLRADLVALPGHWHRIELRHLLCLEAVAEEPSFVAAARRLGYVQSAVSQQLRTLESLTGTRLVQRSRGTRGAALTSEGAQFLRRAQSVLAEMRSAAMDCGRPATLRVAAERHVLVTRLVAALGRAPVAFDEGLAHDRVLHMLEHGESDAGCVVGDVPDAFARVALYHDRWVAVSRSGADTPVTVGDLADAEHICLRGAAADFPLAQSLPQPVAVAETAATLAAMVYAGIGVAVVPESIVQTWRSRLVVRPIDTSVDLTRVVSLAWDGSRPVKTPLRSLVEALTDVCADRESRT
ncbi:MAG: LysR family transcriptional regulator [Gaiellaceae bacterium]